MINLVLQVFFAITIWCSVSVGILRFTLSSPLLDPAQALELANTLSLSAGHFLPILSGQEWLLLGFFALALGGAFLATAMLLWLVHRLQYRM